MEIPATCWRERRRRPLGVSRQSTIIEHHCLTDRGRALDRSIRSEPVELFGLIGHLKQAIAHGYIWATL